MPESPRCFSCRHYQMNNLIIGYCGNPKGKGFVEPDACCSLWETRPDAEQKCRVCGCTWDNACPGGCHWVEPDLCSQCADKE